jgi:hypothetical protein
LKNKDKLTNSDILLFIIEITSNSGNYGIKKSNRSRIFWDAVCNLECLSNITKHFKSETFRKYWRNLSDAGNISSIVKIIKDNTEYINLENLR